MFPDIQIVIITNFVIVSSIGIKRVDCIDHLNDSEVLVVIHTLKQKYKRISRKSHNHEAPPSEAPKQEDIRNI